MDITQFFQKVPIQKIPKQNNNRDLITKLMQLLALVRSYNWIDMLDYSDMMGFFKKGVQIGFIKRYLQIIDKIKYTEDLTRSQIETKNEFITLCISLFPNVYNLVDAETGDTSLNNMMAHIKNTASIKFTSDQLVAIKEICEFLYDDKVTTFGLYGFAGTGKTTLMAKLVAYLIEHKFVSSICFAAPTNKAVDIMKSKFKDDIQSLLGEEVIKLVPNFNNQLDILEKRGINIPFLTIHKLLDFKNDFDMEGERIFTKQSTSSNIPNFNLIIIDECSMLSLQIIIHIFEDIKTVLKGLGKEDLIKKLPKILFVGDEAQLPPVNETNSSIFTKSANQFNYKLFATHVKDDTRCKFKELQQCILSQRCVILKEIVRNGDLNVVAVCNEIRRWIFDPTYKPKIKKYITSVSKVQVYKHNKDSNKLTESWFNKYIDACKQSTSNSNIILTWTNRQTDEYNNKIRQILFNRKKLDEIEKGDILILNDFYITDDKKKDPQYKAGRFYTSEQIKVINVDLAVRVSEPFYSCINDKVRKMKNSRFIEEQFKRVIQTINTKTNRKYDVFKVDVNKIHTEQTVDTTLSEPAALYQIYILRKTSIDKLNEDKQFASNKIKELRQLYLAHLKDQSTALDKKVIKPLWKEYNNRFVNPFANINIAFSITTHKSQGSTFYNVYVDAHDILLNNNDNEAKRCLYTAATRTSNELHILI
jgi:hypothetical protein